jgi:hypothetical protein
MDGSSVENRRLLLDNLSDGPAEYGGYAPHCRAWLRGGVLEAGVRVRLSFPNLYLVRLDGANNFRTFLGALRRRFRRGGLQCVCRLLVVTPCAHCFLLSLLDHFAPLRDGPKQCLFVYRRILVAELAGCPALLFECDRNEGSCAVRNVDEFVLTILDVDAGQIPRIGAARRL